MERRSNKSSVLSILQMVTKAYERSCERGLRGKDLEARVRKLVDVEIDSFEKLNGIKVSKTDLAIIERTISGKLGNKLQ